MVGWHDLDLQERLYYVHLKKNQNFDFKYITFKFGAVFFSFPIFLFSQS